MAKINTHMQTRSGECAHHGHYTSMFVNIGDGYWTKCPICAEAEMAERDTQMVKTMEEERLHNRAMLTLQQSGVPRRMMRESFESYVMGYTHSAEQQKAFTACKNFAEWVALGSDDGTFLTLLGAPGTGKTHLACSIIRYVAFSGTYRRCLYASHYDIIQRAYATYKSESESERQVVLEYGSVDLLVIDEIGTCGESDSKMNLLFAILNHRYNNCLPTVLIGNVDGNELRAVLGDRMYDRLLQVGKSVIFKWPSHRGAK